jgi:hypothetical protein
MRLRLLITARSIVLGWTMLYAVTNLVVIPLLRWAPTLLDASWLPTVQLGLQCVALAATGWIVGRWNEPDRLPATLLFAAMLGVWDLGLVPAINIRWLFQLVIDVFGSSRYLEGLITAVATHALLFGSLFAGAILSRGRKTKPLSLVE